MGWESSLRERGKREEREKERKRERARGKCEVTYLYINTEIYICEKVLFIHKKASI